MLVLSRKTHQTICIGNEITITIASIQGNRVKIGIEAPENVKISRGELVESAPASPRGKGRRQSHTVRENGSSQRSNGEAAWGLVLVPH